MSESMRPHRQQPTRLLHPWDSPGKNAGVGCHCLLCLFSYQPLNKEHTCQEVLVQDCRIKGYVLISSARAPKSQLAVEQPLTGGCWNLPKKKIFHIQRQRRSPNEMLGGAQI